LTAAFAAWASLRSRSTVDEVLPKLAIVHDFSLQLEELHPCMVRSFIGYRKPHKHCGVFFLSQDRRAKLLCSCGVYQRSRLSGSAWRVAAAKKRDLSGRPRGRPA